MLHRWNTVETTLLCRDCSRCGVAALEFVIVLPVLMVIVVGAADWGRILHLENVLTNAARTGAAYGATHRYTDYTYDNWEERVQRQTAEEAAHIPEYDLALLEVTVSTFVDADGSSRVRVDASYPFEMIMNWPGWPKQITLKRSVSMRGFR